MTVQFDLYLRVVFIVEMDGQTDLLFPRGVIGDKIAGVFRVQCFQSILQVINLDFLFLIFPDTFVIFLAIHGDGVISTFQRHVELIDIFKVCGQHLAVAKLIVGHCSQAVAAVLRNFVNDLRITNTDIGTDFFCFFVVGFCLLGGSQFLGVAADGQHKGIGNLLAIFILGGVVHRDGQLGLHQIIGFQFLFRNIVGHIISRVQRGEGFQPTSYSVGIQSSFQRPQT